MSLTLGGGVALVTGAGSGIGRATALALAARGSHLALVDRNAATLAETAERAGRHSVRVTQHVLDVTDTHAVDALPEAVLAAHQRVTVLVNNAGVSLVGRFEELTLEEFRWLIEINFFAVVALTRAFLPVLKRERQAQIVNVSSLFGLIAPPEQTAYSASKFAVRGFSEALRHELEGTGVGVTVVHPGGVRTSIATSARVAVAVGSQVTPEELNRFTEVALRLPPEEAAEVLVKALEQRKKRVVIGRDARAGDLIQRLAPGRYWDLMRRRYEKLKARRG
jgi:short-subunit dehydrogenase